LGLHKAVHSLHATFHTNFKLCRYNNILWPTKFVWSMFQFCVTMIGYVWIK
jgi:hypothetical protein